MEKLGIAGVKARGPRPGGKRRLLPMDVDEEVVGSPAITVESTVGTSPFSPIRTARETLEKAAPSSTASTEEANKDKSEASRKQA